MALLELNDADAYNFSTAFFRPHAVMHLMTSLTMGRKAFLLGTCEPRPMTVTDKNDKNTCVF